MAGRAGPVWHGLLPLLWAIKNQDNFAFAAHLAAADSRLRPSLPCRSLSLAVARCRCWTRLRSAVKGHHPELHHHHDNQRQPPLAAAHWAVEPPWLPKQPVHAPSCRAANGAAKDSLHPINSPTIQPLSGRAITMVMSKAARKAFKREQKEKLNAGKPAFVPNPPPPQQRKRPSAGGGGGGGTQPTAKKPRAAPFVGKGKGTSSGGGNGGSSSSKGNSKGGKGEGKGKGKGKGKGGKGKKGKGGDDARGEGGGGGYAGKHPARPGDWTCHQCYANVFGSLTDCYKCHIPRLGDPTTSGVAEVLARPVPFTSTVRSLHQHFGGSSCKPVSYRLGWDKAGNYCKGYAFLTFASPEAAEGFQREWDTVKMAGKTLVVTPADGVEDELVAMSADEVGRLSKGGGAEGSKAAQDDAGGSGSWDAGGVEATEAGGEGGESVIDGSEYDSFMDSFNDDGSALTTEAELPTNYEALTYDPADYTRQRTELLTRQIATHAKEKQLTQAVAAFEQLKTEGLTPDQYRCVRACPPIRSSPLSAPSAPY
eukprot:SAG22_NODE_385_length_11304_cov_21.304775_9_plen_537_part_00